MKENLSSLHFIPFNVLEVCVPTEVRRQLNKEIPKELWNHIGKRIHIKSKRGMYTLIGLCSNGLIITSNTIQKTHKAKPYEVKKFDDFKCLAGGKWSKY